MKRQELRKNSNADRRAETHRKIRRMKNEKDTKMVNTGGGENTRNWKTGERENRSIEKRQNENTIKG